MEHVHESPMVMKVPMFGLALGATFAGMIFVGPMIGHHWAAFWGHSLVVLPTHTALAHLESLPLWAKLLPLGGALLGIAVTYQMYIRQPGVASALAESQETLYKFLLNKWYFDEIYDFLLVRPAKALGRFLWKTGDGQVIDAFGPDGLATSTRLLARRASALESGYLYHYAFAMLIGVVILMSLYFYAMGI
jgi:NADH-quinone oxidoreductase subunit L